MSIDKIRKALAARADIADWRLVESRTAREERYFVGKSLDLARRSDSVDYRLTVYVDGEGKTGRTRGEAAVSVHPTMGDSEIASLVGRAAFAAASSKNPWFPLPEPKAAAPFAPDGFAGRDCAAWMPILAEALYQADGGSAGARVNSLELFLSRRELRVLNSRGVDASHLAHRGYVELTVDAPGAEGIVELTDSLGFGEPDLPRLGALVARKLALAADRAVAVALPSGLDLPLVLTGEEAAAILGYWYDNLNLARVYSKSSPFQIGLSAQGEGPALDPLTIHAEPRVAGSPLSAPFDGEGVPLASLELMRAGVVRDFVGPSRYAAWLGRPVHGDHPLFSVASGALPEKELRSAPHLEVASFSDFNVDPDSGDFGAEMRLGWVFDGAARRPVRGGSVTGSLVDNRGAMRLSSERELSGQMLGPKTILLPRVSITGAE